LKAKSSRKFASFRRSRVKQKNFDTIIVHGVVFIHATAYNLFATNFIVFGHISLPNERVGSSSQTNERTVGKLNVFKQFLICIIVTNSESHRACRLLVSIHPADSLIQERNCVSVNKLNQPPRHYVTPL